MRIIRFCFSAALLWAATSCSGKVELPAGPEVPAAGSTRVRRLTRDEYDNSIRALTGAKNLTLSPVLAPEDTILGFTTHDRLQVTPLLADQLDNAALNVSQLLKSNLKVSAQCPVGPDEERCAMGILFGVAEQAYRRPLPLVDQLELRTLWRSIRKDRDPDTTSLYVLHAIISSASFLYRTELGSTAVGPDQVVKLTQYEIASALSFAITASPPDAELLTAAREGLLGDPAEREKHARRLLATEAAKAHQDRFIRQWLGITGLPNLNKNNQTYPDFGLLFKDSSQAETRDFINHILTTEQGSIRELLSADYTFADARMQIFYGTLTRTPRGEVGRVTLPANRAGILTQASVMATYALFDSSSPIRRGKFILTRLLCRHQAPPPPTIVIIPPAVTTDSTTRARFAAHTDNPACAGCHRVIDPIGFGMEDFDGLGKYRTQENGLPVDASGSLEHSEGTLTFTGGAQLARFLANSEEVANCVPLQVFRYAMGREENEAVDQELLTDMRTAFRADPRLPLGEAFVALVRSPYFIHRRTQPADAPATE
ncbi:MAG TPA: DUF1592 domain-containing protein [Myxococcus sp.]|nr:DUF1592 domain-containing protein [Myxococcus sp.]